MATSTYPAGAFSPQAQKYYSMLSAKPPHPVVPLSLSAPAQLQFAQQRSGINEGYMQSLAQLENQRAGTTAGYDRQNRDLMFQLGQLRNRLPYGYNARGLLGSGIYGQGLQDYTLMNQRQRGDLAENKATALSQFSLQAQQLERQRTLALAQIEQMRLAMMGQLGVGSIQ